MKYLRGRNHRSRLPQRDRQPCRCRVTMIICPGFKFETALFEAQDKYPNTKFVLLDGELHSADYSVFRIEKNVVGLYWAEHQSGFLASRLQRCRLKTAASGSSAEWRFPPSRSSTGASSRSTLRKRQLQDQYPDGSGEQPYQDPSTISVPVSRSPPQCTTAVLM